MAATVPALGACTGRSATPGTSVMSPPRLWLLTQARTAGKSSAVTSRSLARGRMIVKMARSHPAMLGRDVQQFPDVMETLDRDPDTVGDEPPPLVGIAGDVAGLLRHPVKFCLQLRNGRRETHLLADLLLVILGELAEIIGMFRCLLSEDDPQQLQIATGAGQHLTECFQPGSHGDAARLDTALLLLGSVDLLTDQACLVLTGSCERVERAALSVFCLACACLSTLQVLFGLG